MATEAGRSTAPSEDRAIVGPNLLAVLDGVTAKPETGCVHSVGWFADQLAAELLRFAHLDPAASLAEAIKQTGELHSDSCDLDHPDSPSAAVGLVQIKDDVLRYLVLGDATVVVDTKRELHVVSDTSTNRTAGADPGAVSHALTGEIPLPDVRRVAILSDGAARAVELFNLFEWPKALELMAENGPDDLIRKMRQVEKEDARLSIGRARRFLTTRRSSIWTASPGSMAAELSALDVVLRNACHVRLVEVRASRRAIVVDLTESERDRLRKAMAVRSLPGMVCACMGDVRFEVLDARRERLAVVLLHHGITLAWSDWDGHGVLADGRVLLRWLHEHGLTQRRIGKAEAPSWDEVADRLLNAQEPGRAAVLDPYQKVRT